MLDVILNLPTCRMGENCSDWASTVPNTPTQSGPAGTHSVSGFLLHAANMFTHVVKMYFLVHF